MWDNELPAQPAIQVPSFRIGATPITNAEFLEFVEDGGYEQSEFWTSNPISQAVAKQGSRDSWSWLSDTGMSAPTLWDKDYSKGNFVRTPCNGASILQISADWPAMVTLYEAAAFCQWKGNGACILSETEFHAVFGRSMMFNAAARQGNNNWKYRTYPVGTMDDGVRIHENQADAVHDMVGNGWEWTSTVFNGLEGFSPMATYPEYSTDFFDGKHFVLKGASPYTSQRLQRLSFRNFFQPNYAFVHAKFRVAYS